MNRTIDFDKLAKVATKPQSTENLVSKGHAHKRPHANQRDPHSIFAEMIGMDNNNVNPDGTSHRGGPTRVIVSANGSTPPCPETTTMLPKRTSKRKKKKDHWMRRKRGR